MISVTEAKKLITRNTKLLKANPLELKEAYGSVLSENVISPVNLPLFDQSAMDGYAIVYADYIKKKQIKIKGEIAAGQHFKRKILSGSAVRIYTGAQIPSGADTVVMQEKTELNNNELIIKDANLKKGSNIRSLGSQIKKGHLALQKGNRLTAGSIGYLAAMGITSIKAFSKPRIITITTGSELVKPGKKLHPGKIYESNSYALIAALQSIHIEPLNSVSVNDNEDIILNSIRLSLQKADIVLITGGISVGDYDFVGSSLKKLGVKNIFYKIKQKPGKPLFFGKSGETLVFALPGNPAAVLSCFYEYVFPAIQLIQGRKDAFIKKIKLPISKDYSKNKGLSFFLKGKISDNTVIPLEGQESFVLSSFAVADCMIYLPEESENIKAGELVEVHILPGLI